MWLDKKIQEHKKIERYILFFILVCFVVVSGRYLYISFFSNNPNNITSKIKDFELKKNNANYLKKSKDKHILKYYNLRRLSNGKWIIIDNNGNPSKKYKVENNNGKIAIKKVVEPKRLDIDISNVSNYFSQSGYVITDIPYFIGDKYYLVPEQEDRFPIFGYHNVFKTEKEIKNPFMDIRENDFISQVDFLNKKMNCRWLTLDYVAENYILKEDKIPRNTCVMTFDDGRKNNYDIVFPILKKNNINATFFIIFDRLGEKGYMTRNNIGELFRAGNEIGSHTLSGGSLINTDWFDGKFTETELYRQISGSRNVFNNYFFNVNTFAYPLGEWNDNIVSLIKEAGYIVARDTERKKGRDPRSLSVSWDDNFIWHLNYYKPELRYNEEIRKEIDYNGWWQFEDGYKIEKDIDNDIKVLSLYRPTLNSYAGVALNDIQDKISKKFIVSKDGIYNIEVFGTVNTKDLLEYSNKYTMNIYIDDNKQELKNNFSKECLMYKKQYYCSYVISTNLNKGVHIISIEAQQKGIKVDKFRMYRKVNVKNEYLISVVEK